MLLNIIINSLKRKGAYFIFLSLVFVQFFSLSAGAVSFWTTLPPSVGFSARILYDQGVHLFDQDLFLDDQSEYWDRLSVRAGLSYRR